MNFQQLQGPFISRKKKRILSKFEKPLTEQPGGQPKLGKQASAHHMEL